MASLLHSESRRLYSWWWDSHISPKNSKWLQENLKDMDSKVKSMIKLIEEDADSFARRAEMYYKKRPELMKLVEEFYRAYRALAERYDHATGEIRQAHQTIAEAFSNHVPYALADDLGSDVEPGTPEIPHPFPACFDADEFRKDVECLSINSFPSSSSEESGFGNGKKGLKQLNEMLGLAEQDHNVMNGRSRSSSENRDLGAQILVESELAVKAESEAQHLKKTLEAIEADKVALFHKYDQSLNKLSIFESKLNEVEKDANLCNERASIVENEIEILNEALIDLEAERDAALLQYNQCVERMSVLEHALFQAQDDAIGLNNRALEAENEVESLKNDLSVLASEKETGLLQYKQCLGMMSSLEDKIALSEENSRMLSGQNERSEIEIRELKETILNLKEEKDATSFLYQQCLETIAKQENELSCALENTKQLDSEIFYGAAKLKSMEEQHLLLKTSNQCLQKEANHLIQKIADKDRDLQEKQRELELIQRTLLQEQSQFHQVEATLLSLQKLHSLAKEEQKALALELENRLQNLKALEACNFDLRKDLERVETENHNLNEVNMTSATSIKNLQAEIIDLKDLKEGIEKEVNEQTYRSNGLQQEVGRLKEEIDALDKAYQALLQQLRCAGLNPECVEAYVKQLQNENLDLKVACNKHTVDMEVLVTKVDQMDILIDQNANLRCSHSELNGKLEGSKEMVQELQKSCQLLQGEKSAQIVEKATILTQLQIMTDNIQNLLEEKTLLETSLSGANIKLERLKFKSRTLEDFCQFLRNEKSNLENERSTLVSLLQNVEQRLHSLEERFINLEGKYAVLEKEKESTVTQLGKLQSFYHEDRKLHACYAQSSESRFAGLESDVHTQQEENRSRNKDCEEELDKAVKAQVEMFILHKFITDLEEKNSFMLIECQKHAEATKISNKLIKELEGENLEQMEIDFLLDEVQRLRKGIHQLFWALHFDQEKRQEEILKPDQIAFPHILDRIEDLRVSLSMDMEEKQELLVENSVLLASLGQLKLDGTDIESEKGALAKELMIAKNQKAMLQEEKQKMLGMNEQLTLDVNAKIQPEDVLLTDLESYRKRLVDMTNAQLVLQEEKSKQLEEDGDMHARFLDFKERINVLQEENSSALQEALAFRSLSLVLECFGTEKIDEVQTLCENLGSFQIVNKDLMEQMHNLSSQLELKNAESLHLKMTVEELYKELSSANDSNAELNYEFAIGKEFLKQKAVELSEFEERLQSAHNLNAELCGTLDLLKREMQESKYTRENLQMNKHQISQTNSRQEEEIKHLHEENGTLVSEISTLQNEIEENKRREENLSLEFQDKSNEVEIWEAEAASFYFDFQISAIHEVLLENKVHELASTCKSLGEECSVKDVQIKEMMSRIKYLECEVGRLQSHLSSYVPVVASLKSSVVSLEKHSHAWTRCTPGYQGKLGSESSHVLGGMDLKETQDQNRIGATGIAGLQEIQMRLKEVEEAIEEHVNNLSVTKNIDASTTSDGQNSEEREQRDYIFHNRKSKLMKPEIVEPRPAISLKDIPLDQVSDSCYRSHRRQKGSSDDQMLELWEMAEQDCGTDLGKQLAQVIDGLSASHSLKDAQLGNSDLASGIEAENEVAVDKLEVATYSRESMRGASSRTLLETLASDARQLTSLQTTVQELRKKVEKTKRSKRTNDHEYRRVKQQLQELEQAIVELANMNGQLTWEIEDSPSSIDMKCLFELEGSGSTHRKRVTEHTQKESERIEKLQFEVQRLGHFLLKLENERKHKGKLMLSGSRTSSSLKGFIHRSDKHGGKKKKKNNKKAACLCGCRRPSTKED